MDVVKRLMNSRSDAPRIWNGVAFLVVLSLGLGGLVYASSMYSSPVTYNPSGSFSPRTTAPATSSEPTYPPLDRDEYDERMRELANYPAPATTTASTTATTTRNDDRRWPPDAPYPKRGAILPFHRVVAYYGNFYSTKMGALGQYPPDEMISRLKDEVAQWEKADPDTPVMPAIHYIAMVARGTPGADGLYRRRMPHDQIEKALDLAERVDGIVFLDIQIGLSSLRAELPYLKEFLKEPNVHLAIDPEFAMPDGVPPGEQIGSLTASEINYAIEYLSDIVREHDLPPKILVAHRFTQNMIQNYQQITPGKRVQFVMDMDGWGPPRQKRRSYRDFIYPEPVQFTGFKVFYNNDRKPPSPGIMTPEAILKLRPQPI